MADMKEKLVELLRVHPCSNVDCEKCGEFQDSCWLGKLADKLIAHGVTVQDRLEEKQATSDKTSEWISVKDRLPQIGQRVLVYCSSRQLAKHVTCCTYYNGYLGSRIWSRRVRNVTHWMPMPEPPKGE